MSCPRWPAALVVLPALVACQYEQTTAPSQAPATSQPASAAAPAKAAGPKLAYPSAERGTVVDDYHGTKVADPYRGLEEYTDATNGWIEAENKVTFGYLESIPERGAIKDRLTKLWNFERYTPPSKEAGRYFFGKNNGLQNQNVLYVTESLSAEPRVLLDPNTLRADGTVALVGTSVTEDGKLLAYGTADAGSDWNVWKVRNMCRMLRRFRRSDRTRRVVSSNP